MVRPGLARPSPMRCAAPSMLEGASPLRSAATAALASLLLLSPLQMSPTSPFMPTIAAAEAKELPSGSGSRVNKDPLSLLRLGLPAQSKEMRELQKGLEECQDNSARLLNSNAVGALAKAQGVASGKAAALVKGVPSEYSAKAQALVSELDSGMATLKSQLAAGSSEASKTNAALLEKVSELEGLVALGYDQPLPPKEYAELPYLTRRATVEFTFKKPDGSSFDIDRTLFKVRAAATAAAMSARHASPHPSHAPHSLSRWRRCGWWSTGTRRRSPAATSSTSCSEASTTG